MFSGPFHESSQELQVQGGTIVRVAKARKLVFTVSYEQGEGAHTGSQRSNGH
jgi:hypothetical protein